MYMLFDKHVTIAFYLNKECRWKINYWSVLTKFTKFVHKDSFFPKRKIDSVCKAARISESRAPFRSFRSFSRRWCHASLVRWIFEREKSLGNKAALLIRDCDYVFCPEDLLWSYTNLQSYALQSSDPFVHLSHILDFFIWSAFIIISFKTIAIWTIFSKIISF